MQPVIVDKNFAGVGFFQSKQVELAPGVIYFKASGIGLYKGHNCLGLGWIDQEHIAFEQSEAGVHLQTPMGEIATGKHAERFAEHMASDCGMVLRSNGMK